MAEDFIVDLYEYAFVVTNIKKMIELGRSEKVTALLDSWKEQGETIAATSGLFLQVGRRLMTISNIEKAR